jgi:hypothetical protein
MGVGHHRLVHRRPLTNPSGFSQLLSIFMGDFYVVFSIEERVRYVTFRDRLSESKRKGDNSVLRLYFDWQEDSGVLQVSEAQ